MKVLLLYKYRNHYHLLSDMMEEMTKRGMSIAALDVVHFKYHGSYCPQKKKVELISHLLRIPKLRGFLLNFFKNKWITNVAKDFDIVDIHAFSSDYENLMNQLNNVQKKIAVTYWGSDLFRANDAELKKHIKLFEKVVMIRTTSPDALRIVEQMHITTNISMCRFGVGNLERIQALKQLKKTELLRYLQGVLPTESFGKVLVIIGSNGSKEQQHLKILQALNAFKTQLHNLHFIIPVSYGLDKNYREEIKNALTLITTNFTFVERFLSRDELNALILLSNIFISAQKTDAFSAYVQEHLAAGTVVMSGEWLPYFVLRQQGIYIEDFNFTNFNSKFSHLIENLEFYSEKARIQNKAMFEISAWQTLGEHWYESYKQIN